MDKPTAQDIKRRKNPGHPLVVLTAYTAPMAKMLAPHVDIILVGDSVGMVLYGMENTLGVTLDMMIRHSQAVRCGAPNAFIVVDMPYGWYEDTHTQAMKTAAVLLERGGADAVKLEGGQEMADTIAYLVEHDIPVMGHIGLLPQAVEKDGGFKIKGKTSQETARLIEDAKAIEQAGAFCFVLEGTIEKAAREITAAVSIPSIGIGASGACDGQVLVTEDMLGLSGGHVPKFVKVYNDLEPRITDAIKHYAQDVRMRVFPSEPYTYRAEK
jgi:3-methyl-2-oxobutanoate hydroxymethyltransferase